MATPVNLKHFLEQTRLTGVKLCFDTGHANIEGGLGEALEAVRDLVITTHIHDNHGERDDHLLPYQGNIDWDATLSALPPEAPMVLELKEPAVAAGSGEILAFAETLQGVRSVFDQFEQALAKA